ncbi:MAG: feruloyl-CoA synthase [Burkholderiales bacterium]|nr:feruloyl-CoA synthase [Burkholderiales bacterium]
MSATTRDVHPDFAPAQVDVERRADGSLLLRSPQPLADHARCLGEHLKRWAQTRPEQVFLAERDDAGAWRRLTYAHALQQVRACAAALLTRGLGSQRPVAILSDNSITQALLTLAAMHVGVPVAPISPAYSFMSRDFGRLRAAAALLQPGLVYVEDPQRFAPALQAVDWQGAELVSGPQHPPPAGFTSCTQLLASTAGAEVERAYHAVGPDTIAKILLTSGSTGEPKGVINTQRMLCANQQQLLQVWPFVVREPPIICDWLPWNHTFGGNHNFNLILATGGTLYIDAGKPVPGLIERTLANLREVSPSIYFNVPRGFDMLVPALERDDDLRVSFFRNMKMLFYAAAALPQNLWERLEALSRKQLGRRVHMVSAWGATETAPLATGVHYTIDRPGIIGLPVPACTLKMVPSAGKLELRVRGPNVTPGYWRRDDLTAAAFDEEGFYRIGDAGRLFDDTRPQQGIVFDGRVAEDFKLSSGTWVHVGQLRVQAIAALDPVAQDVVVAGHDRAAVGLLVFLGPRCRALVQSELALSSEELAVHPLVHAHVRAALACMAQAGSGSSTHAARALLMSDAPDIDAGEITDKGYINQRAVLTRRAALVEELFSDPPSARTVVLERVAGQRD